MTDPGNPDKLDPVTNSLNSDKFLSSFNATFVGVLDELKLNRKLQ